MRSLRPIAALVLLFLTAAPALSGCGDGQKQAAAEAPATVEQPAPPPSFGVGQPAPDHDIRLIDEQGRVIGTREYPTDHTAILAAMLRFNPIANSTVMFRRGVYERFGAVPESGPCVGDATTT